MDAQLVLKQPSMSIEKKNMMGRFLRFAPPRFSSPLREDSFDFLTTYVDKLPGLGLVKVYVVDYKYFS